MRTKKDLSASVREFLRVSRVLDAAFAEANEAYLVFGVDLYETGYVPERPTAKPQRRIARTAPPKKRGRPPKQTSEGREEFKELKLQHRSVNALHAAGYSSYEKLNGVSKKKLGEVRWLGANAIPRIVKVLAKRGMALKD
ncbi:MAG: hypothetical protein ABA06_02080 [Parcubacteria bacterium C7867-001]|nr:MAG: hypothetical protein ABA06_02080 [Parcubacteria bacterium C7867-001]